MLAALCGPGGPLRSARSSCLFTGSLGPDGPRSPVAFHPPWNALRCARAAVGLTVGPQERTPEAIRASVRIVLANSMYARNPQGLQRAIQQMPGPEVTVRLLELLAAYKQPLESAQETRLPEHA